MSFRNTWPTRIWSGVASVCCVQAIMYGSVSWLAGSFLAYMAVCSILLDRASQREKVDQ